jgi:hypothetical protein
MFFFVQSHDTIYRFTLKAWIIVATCFYDKIVLCCYLQCCGIKSEFKTTNIFFQLWCEKYDKCKLQFKKIQADTQFNKNKVHRWLRIYQFNKTKCIDE